MDKKLIFFFILGIFFIGSVSAYYPSSHRYWDLKSLSEVSSPITKLCTEDNDFTNLVVDGESAADATVIHYYDNEFLSYVATHTRGIGFTECLAQAGTDPELLCICYGIGLHNVQDHFAHTDDGLVPTYLKSNLAPNLLGHMAIENSYDTKHIPYLDGQGDVIVTSGTLAFYDTIYLDSFFPEFGGKEKYVRLLNTVTGIDTRNDLNIVSNGYKGVGFFDTVYNQKLKLPWWGRWSAIGAMVIGFGLSLVFIFTGRTAWKWLLIIPWVTLGILGLLILISFQANTTWQWLNAGLGATSAVGLLEVSDADIIIYNDRVLEASKRFLETGVLPFDDNSGLTYIDRDGIQRTGALIEAERTGFRNIMLPILAAVFALLNGFLIFKTYGVRKVIKNDK